MLMLTPPNIGGLVAWGGEGRCSLSVPSQQPRLLATMQRIVEVPHLHICRPSQHARQTHAPPHTSRCLPGAAVLYQVSPL